MVADLIKNIPGNFSSIFSAADLKSNGYNVPRAALTASYSYALSLSTYSLGNALKNALFSCLNIGSQVPPRPTIALSSR